jgi:hypothetical protein
VQGGIGVITENMLRYLKEASPWIRFLSILGYIINGLVLLGGVSMSILSFFNYGSRSFFAGIPAVAGGLIYLVFGILSFIPNRFLYKFGSKTRNYVQTNVGSELETALQYNKSFWKFLGIITIVYLAFLPVLGIVFFIVAVSTGLFS